MVVKEENERIDKYLSNNLSYSRDTINNMIKMGYILVNGKIVKPSYKVRINDVIDVIKEIKKDTSLKKIPMDLDIVYEDDDLMVINKQSGIVVHPGSGNKDNTLVNGLLYYTDKLSTSDTRPGIVHRLDKDTSGLMLVTKSDKAKEVLSDDFKNKRVYREYIALVDGIFPQESAIIDAPLGRDKTYFDRMTVVKNGKSAITHVSVLKRYKHNTLLKLVLDTGRTHQIRVHLAYIGFPIVNDPVYNKGKSTEFGQLLHSSYIKFKHPITNKILEFKVDLPQYFQEFLNNI